MFGNFSLFKTPFLGQRSVPISLALFFFFYIFFLPPFEDNGLLFWVPDVLCQHQELFCGICSVFKCSFDKLVGGESGLPALFLHHLKTALLLWVIKNK